MRHIIINGRPTGWADLKQHYVCRKCRQPIGRPYADLISGELDHERMVCAGEMEHEIRSQADVMRKEAHDWLAAREEGEALDVLAAYPWLAKELPTLAPHSLYGDDNFEGFA